MEANGKPDDDAILFAKAMEQYKKDNKRKFPTCSEMLEVARAIGFRKILPRKAKLPRFIDGKAKQQK